eukprot:709101_1
MATTCWSSCSALIIYVYLTSFINSQSISSCIRSNNVVHNWNIATYLINDGWTQCYSTSYSTNTCPSALTENCQTGQDYYVFVGALSTSLSQYALIGAYAPSSVLTEFTTTSTTAMKPIGYENTSYNVHWYNYYAFENYIRAFAFAPNSEISLALVGNPGYSGTYVWDSVDSTNNERLSWSCYGGGSRAGALRIGANNDIYQKVIYYKYCPDPTPSTDLPPSIDPRQMVTRCIKSNDITHYWNLKYLTNDGWTECYSTPYSTYTSPSAMTESCQTGQDYYVFVGALSTSFSQYALIGAYAPSSVLTEFTITHTTARKPIEYENTSYNVYWYNHYEFGDYIRAFGFAPNSEISLTLVGNPGYSNTYAWGSVDSTNNERLSWSYYDGGSRAGAIEVGSEN